MAKRKVKAVAETGDIDLSSPPSMRQDADAGAARAAAYFQQEHARANARRAAHNASPHRVLSADERAEIAALNREYVSPTRRVRAHGVRGWPAAAPLSRSGTASEQDRAPCGR
jgi:hypothetical protein